MHRRISGVGVPILSVCLEWFLWPAWKGDKLVSDKFSAVRGRHYHGQQSSAVADMLRLSANTRDVLLANGPTYGFLKFYYHPSKASIAVPNYVTDLVVRSRLFAKLGNKLLGIGACFILAYRTEWGC